MSDTSSQPQQSVPMPVVQDDLRTPAIIIYILYLGAVISVGVAGIIGVIVAYVKRDDAKGTIWESHYKNQIESFWIWLVLFVAGCLTVWIFFIGVLIIVASFVYFLYRTIRGLLRALENKPYP
jgi:uncharacterized membrane protein